MAEVSLTRDAASGQLGAHQLHPPMAILRSLWSLETGSVRSVTLSNRFGRVVFASFLEARVTGEGAERERLKASSKDFAFLGLMAVLNTHMH